MSEFTKQFFDLSHLILKEFDRNIALHGNKIKCRKGCSQCCYQIFKITLVDASIISEYISKLPISKKNLIKEKANDYLNARNNTHDDVEFSLTPGSLPCPALGEQGECTIYEARPIICRRFGPPIYDYKNPQNLFACELNFSEGEEIKDDDLIEKQTEIGVTWDKLKTDFNISHGLKENASTTIAEAILNA